MQSASLGDIRRVLPRPQTQLGINSSGREIRGQLELSNINMIMAPNWVDRSLQFGFITFLIH